MCGFLCGIEHLEKFLSLMQAKPMLKLASKYTGKYGCIYVRIYASGKPSSKVELTRVKTKPCSKQGSLKTSITMQGVIRYFLGISRVCFQ